jgi:type VI secretion system protein ImpJ
VRSAAGIPVLDPTFVAPCLDLSSSDYLMSILKRQVEILATKSSGLSASRRERGKATAEFTASETANFWLLHTVNSYLPTLRHIQKVRRGHPEAAYLAMLNLAGALSTFSLEGSPADLPDYDHDDLGLCFSRLDARLRELMETVIPSKYRAIPLVMTNRQTWSGSVDDDALFRNSHFYLAVSANMGMDDIIRKVPQYLKLAAPDQIERLIHHALGGVVLRHVQVPPAAIPIKLDNQYFALNQSGGNWERIVMSRQISVFAPSEIVDPKMEIVVVME